MKKSLHLLRVSLNAEETVTVFPALFFYPKAGGVDIAARLKRSAAAIYEELKRGYTGEFDGYARPKYSADLAQATVQENFRRRGNRRGANC